MYIDVLTIFPNMFKAILSESIIKRAQKRNKVKINLYNLRDYTQDKHRKVDDRPFGGGAGMVMKLEPIFYALKKLRKNKPKGSLTKTKVILLSPQGKKLEQKLVKRLAQFRHLILVCGHYEGVDERVRQHLVDEEISIGDYILTGGELAAMVLIDALVRLVPGVLGEKKSLQSESFEGNLLEYPQYTRPANFRGMKVPSVLLSGDHQRIEKWRKEQALLRTARHRPDMLKKIKQGEKDG